MHCELIFLPILPIDQACYIQSPNEPIICILLSIYKKEIYSGKTYEEFENYQVFYPTKMNLYREERKKIEIRS